MSSFSVTNNHIDKRSVKILLIQRDWTLADLGERLGCTGHALSQIINGKRPHSKKIPLIAEALGVPFDDILQKPAEPIGINDETLTAA